MANLTYGTHLVVDLNKIAENSKKVVELCAGHGIEVLGVTKGFSAEPRIVSAMLQGGITKLADARLENVMRLRRHGFTQHITLLRIPMISQVNRVVEACDCSLNSEIEVIRALSAAALEKGKRHEIILMIDVGDLREGVAPGDAEELLRQALPLKGIHIAGIGTNMGCYGGILPTENNLTLLVNVAEALAEIAGEPFEVVSGGGTSSLKVAVEGNMPAAVNQVRVGEGILLGTDSTNDRIIRWLDQDAFMLRAEIVELNSKPTMPIGTSGRDAFGNKPVFEDKGIRRRAIVALGQQDVPLGGVSACDGGIRIMGASSDHMILDIEESGRDYRIGDMVEMKLNYKGLLRVCSSRYIPHVYIP